MDRQTITRLLRYAYRDGHGPTASVTTKYKKSSVFNTKVQQHINANRYYNCLFTAVCPDYPSESLPEETFTHSNLSRSSIILYLLPPSTMIHSILPVQFMCLTVFLHNLCQSFLWSTLSLAPSTSYSIHFFTQSLSSFHNTCRYQCNLFCCSPNQSMHCGDIVISRFFNMITIDHLVSRITVCILPTCPHLRSANFGPRFTHWQSASLHFTHHLCIANFVQCIWLTQYSMQISSLTRTLVAKRAVFVFSLPPPKHYTPLFIPTPK